LQCVFKTAGVVGAALNFEVDLHIDIGGPDVLALRAPTEQVRNKAT
jgi:hypothetical protein